MSQYETQCPRCLHRFISRAPLEWQALALSGRTMDIHYMANHAPDAPLKGPS